MREEKEEGVYITKRVTKLPKRGNANYKYIIKGEEFDKFYLWLNGKYEEVLNEGGSITVTDDTGSEVYMGNVLGNSCNMTNANKSDEFSLINLKAGGEATILINNDEEPTIAPIEGISITKLYSHDFEVSTDMHLYIKCRTKDIVEYYLLKIG